MLGVLYPNVWQPSLASYINYNTRWRGLTELLISDIGNAKARVRDKRQKVSPTPFLFPLILIIY